MVLDVCLLGSILPLSSQVREPWSRERRGESATRRAESVESSPRPRIEAVDGCPDSDPITLPAKTPDERLSLGRQSVLLSSSSEGFGLKPLLQLFAGIGIRAESSFSSEHSRRVLYFRFDPPTRNSDRYGKFLQHTQCFLAVQGFFFSFAGILQDSFSISEKRTFTDMESRMKYPNVRSLYSSRQFFLVYRGKKR